MIKNPPAMWEIWVQSLGWEDPPEEGRATYSIILAWRIHMGLASYSPWGGKESDMTEQLNTTQLITMLLIPILQQSDSILHIYSFLIFFSIIIYHKTLF